MHQYKIWKYSLKGITWQQKIRLLTSTTLSLAIGFNGWNQWSITQCLWAKPNHSTRSHPPDIFHFMTTLRYVLFSLFPLFFSTVFITVVWKRLQRELSPVSFLSVLGYIYIYIYIHDKYILHCICIWILFGNILINHEKYVLILMDNHSKVPAKPQ